MKRVPLSRALELVQRHDYLNSYVDDCPMWWTCTPSARMGCATAPIRWAGRGGLLGGIAERHNRT